MDATQLPVAGTVVLLRDAASGPEVLLIRRPDRGSFGGGWVFPGGLVEPQDRRAGAPESDDARRAAMREAVEEVGLQPAGLVAMSLWVPPIEAPKRVRTWFFLAAAPDGEVRAAPDEVAEWTWLSPAEALARHAAGGMLLFPPTWVTLDGFVGVRDVAAALAAVGEPELFSTRVIAGEIGATFAWEGDAEHHLAPRSGGRHRLETASLPWRYTRD